MVRKVYRKSSLDKFRMAIPPKSSVVHWDGFPSVWSWETTEFVDEFAEAWAGVWIWEPVVLPRTLVWDDVTRAAAMLGVPCRPPGVPPLPTSKAEFVANAEEKSFPFMFKFTVVREIRE